MYAKYFKRLFDFSASLCALVVLSPVMLILIAVGAVQMGGNPFFTQERPGKDGKIFRLIKFRSMNNKRDASGELLPDMQRITRYGRFIRRTSLDELPELLNILKGDMSIVGPRPLLVKYLTLYNERQMHRHDVRPGLTGYAQIHGRNTATWEERFELDLWYVNNISFWNDINIIFGTVAIVMKREGITTPNTSNVTMEEFKGNGES